VNVLGPLALFRATAPLLRAAASSAESPIGKFIVIGSVAGSITSLVPAITACYGLSKAAVNYLCRKLQDENKDLIVVSVW
jgi:norsolorinic acid ketoreductase